MLMPKEKNFLSGIEKICSGKRRTSISRACLSRLDGMAGEVHFVKEKLSLSMREFSSVA
jgi:hypothetical protein